MAFDKLVLTIASKLDQVVENKKSILQADISYLKDHIEDEIFKLKMAEHNYLHQKFSMLAEKNVQPKEAIGLLFLSYLTCSLHNKLTYSSIWPVIIENLRMYSKINTFFIDHYIQAGHANPFLIDCIGMACERFNLRNSYDNAKDEHYIRNTILLQLGLLNKFTNIHLWLSGHLSQVTIKALLNKEHENYSNSFAQGWRVLRKYRDRIIDTSVTKSLLLQNVWIKELDLEELLIASRKSLGTKFLSEDEIDHVFFLDKIFYQERILHFEINAEDLYALKLEGNDYSVYVDGVYASKVLRNDDKVLYLDRPIVIKDPVDFNVYLEMKNEDGDIVYNEEVLLFDLHDQVIIFDEKGDIYKDFSKKLPSNRIFGMLFDSDLDCDAPNENQSEYFSGYVTLAYNLSRDNNCMLSYDGEKLFSLNFTTSVQKPDWIDQLVVYTADTRMDIGKEVEFHLRIFDSNDDEAIPVNLPNEAQILRWTYASGYVDEKNIVDSSAKIELEPDLVCERKHSFMIKFENNVYQRTVTSAIFDQANVYHILRRDKSGDIKTIAPRDIVNYDDLIESKLHFALFNYQQSGATRYIKDKMKLYGKVKLNKKTLLTGLPKFGETIILSEHLYNDVGIVVFKVIRQGIVQKYRENINSIVLRNAPGYLDKCEFITINNRYKVQSLTKVQYEISGNTIIFDEEYLSVIMIYEDNYVGSFVQYEKIDFKQVPADENLLKSFYAAYLPLLILDKHLLIEWIRENLILFFHVYFSDYYETPRQQKVVFNFDDVSAAIEHLLFDVVFSEEDAQSLLQEAILNGWSNKLIKMPTFLVYLLVLAKSQKYIVYFINMLPADIIEPVERDEQFIESIVHGLLSHHDLSTIQKHNLKIAMHYKYKDFYLNEALNKMKG